MTDAQLPYMCAFLVGFVIMAYVLLDGFDLGVGILFPWTKSKDHRDIMMNSIAPVWDGNQTWLVLGGALLYGCFPLAFSTLMPIFYVPILTMSLALVFRGVAFEFRFKADKAKVLWSFVFGISSTIAAFSQGVILGTFVHGMASPGGIPVNGWFTPFSLFAGLGVITGYSLLGSTWLVIKTSGELQQTMARTSKHLLWAYLFMMIVVSIWTPLAGDYFFHKWISFPRLFYLSPLPILAFSCIIIAYRSLLTRKHEALPFLCVTMVFLLAFAGFLYSVWPFLVPHHYTIPQAASDASGLRFVLIGALVLIPVLGAYSAYGYYVFRGKVGKSAFYH